MEFFSEDFKFDELQRIPDKNDTEPLDWEKKFIFNKSEKKPADWDNDEMIPDDTAEKPEDWDEEKEGEWKIPMINNPNYRGKWNPKRIYNKKYKGPWKARKISNPYFTETDLPSYEFGGIGIDVINVQPGTIFDNMLISDSLEEALAIAREILEKQVAKEKEFKIIEEAEEAKKHEKRKRPMMEIKMSQKGAKMSFPYEVEQQSDLQYPHSESQNFFQMLFIGCLLYTSPSPRDLSTSRMPSSA
eukprot:TRINITY_DN1838_c0_g1_i5.p1 TRINITY_DN1838_c0_g1~~TRINITY_DN1838_c0_g1_i5.p1  ORF type:complete len:244 (+),score=59.33 TRINITY_DN1838_c0_g1_i5:459-1190(+)